MKRLLAIVLVLFIGLGAAVAQDGGFEPLMAPGDLAVTAGIGWGFLYGAIDVSGGVELMLGKFMIGDTLPLTYGVAAKASYYKYNYGGFGGDYYYSFLGAGGFGTLHLGLKDADLPEGLDFMDNTDWYIGLGAGFYSYDYSYYGDEYVEFRLGLRSVGGVNYFFTPNFAINVEGGYYGGWGGGLIGLLFKL